MAKKKTTRTRTSRKFKSNPIPSGLPQPIDVIKIACSVAVGNDHVPQLITELAVCILRESRNHAQDGPDVNLLRWTAARMRDNRDVRPNVAVMPPIMRGDIGE